MMPEKLRKLKIKEIEDILYQWSYFEHLEKEYNAKIRELEFEKNIAREKFPISFREINQKSNGTSNVTEKTAIYIIIEIESKIENLKKEKIFKLEEYIIVKEIFNSLAGDEKELIRMKYIEKLRGEKIYKALNYSKSGFIQKKNRILNTIIHKKNKNLINY